MKESDRSVNINKCSEDDTDRAVRAVATSSVSPSAVNAAKVASATRSGAEL